MRRLSILIILFFIENVNATEILCRDLFIDSIQNKTQASEENSNRDYHEIGDILKEMRNRGVNISSQKSVEKETQLISELTKKYLGQTISKRAFFQLIFTNIGGWKKVLKEFNLEKKEIPTEEKIKYLSFMMSLLERSSTKENANEILNNPDLFMNVYAEFFPQSQSEFSAILSRIELLFGSWNNAVEQLSAFDISLRITSEKENVFELFRKLNRDGLNIENYKLIDEISEENWNRLTNEVFGRTISKRTFKTISIKYEGIATILKELNLGIEFKKRKTWHGEKILDILRELHNLNIDVSVWSDLIEQEDLVKQIIKKHTKKDMQVISFLKKVAIEFGSLYDAFLELKVDIKGKKGTRISRYKAEIMNEVAAVGINKERNFYRNRKTFWRIAEEKTGVKFRKDEIKSWIGKFYGNDRIYFKEKLFYSELRPILLKRLADSRWDYHAHHLDENFKFLKRTIEDIYGFPVSKFRVYAFIVVFELDQSNFNLNDTLLALAQTNYVRHLKSYESNEDKIGFDSSTDEMIIVDESSNPETILENEQSSKGDLVKRIINDFDFSNPQMAEMILNAIIDNDKMSVDEIMYFVPNCEEKNIMEVFRTIQGNKDLFMDIFQ